MMMICVRGQEGAVEQSTHYKERWWAGLECFVESSS